MARRPSTSQGVRPDSAMSSRGHSIPPVPPVVVKKTRAPAQARNDPAKTSRVRRKSPLSGPGPSVPTNEGTVDVSSSSAALPTNAPSSSQTSDIDSLTSGMKKIRINLTTKSQREAKVQGKAGTPPTTSTAAIKPASIRPTQPPQTQVPPSNSSAMPTAPFNQGTDTKEAEPKSLAENFPPTPSTPPPAYVPSHIHNAAQIPLPVSSPAEAPFPQPTRAQPSPASSSDVFIPYQPEGPTQNTTVQHEPLRWLPPNTSTPSPMKRGDPPMFTATSAIPFGPNPNASQVSKPQENPKNGENRPPRDDSIWEVPETPEKKR
jgi:histone deacetylase HOS3